MKILPILLLLLSTTIFAQTSATTADGKKVILKSDKTWEYVKDAPGSGKTLNVEAGLVYRSGDVKPIARSEFYLLDKDFIAILKEAGLATGDEQKIYVDVGFAFSPKYATLASQQEKRRAVLEAIKPHIVKTFTTDFSGKATVTELESRTYHLFGVAGTPKGYALWSMPVDLSATDSLVLDQNNMQSGI